VLGGDGLETLAQSVELGSARTARAVLLPNTRIGVGIGDEVFPGIGAPGLVPLSGRPGESKDDEVHRDDADRDPWQALYRHALVGHGISIFGHLVSVCKIRSSIPTRALVVESRIAVS